MKPLKINIKPIHPSFRMPVYSHQGDAGMDIFSMEIIQLIPGERKKVNCGFSIEIPEGYFGAIAPRSGLSLQHGLTLGNAWGVIDSSYRGEICVIIINLGEKKVSLPPYSRIAQLIVIPVVKANLVLANDSLNETDRGVKGFGSTGF